MSLKRFISVIFILGSESESRASIQTTGVYSDSGLEITCASIMFDKSEQESV